MAETTSGDLMAQFIEHAPLFLLDLLLKSIVLLLVFILLERAGRKYMSAPSRHLLWLSSLLCAALLPFMPAMVAAGLPGEIRTPVLFEMRVSPDSTAGVVSAGSGMFYWSMWLLALYLLPSLLLLLRLSLALFRLVRSDVRAREVQRPELLDLVESLRSQMGISRRVRLVCGTNAGSPVSWGLFRPRIVLPEQAEQWSLASLSDVLVHELSHIRRFDWPILLFSRVITSLLWLNPLAWLVVRRLNEEAENSCDAAVIENGRSGTEYAQTLISIARSCTGDAQSSSSLAQTVLDSSTLKSRISTLLEDNAMIRGKNDLVKSGAMLGLLSLTLLVVFGTTQTVSTRVEAQGAAAPEAREIREIPADAEMLPIVNVTPVYPAVAAQEGIKGWVQVKFTVDDLGRVPPHTIQVVDAQPSDIFNESAIRATERFRFSPRVRNNQPVAVPGVQYVFRFALQEE
ncbi:MAG: M56 family metallopeptidase [Pseudohongiellaceae bacterium]